MKINIKQNSQTYRGTEHSPAESNHELRTPEVVRQQRFLEAEFRRFSSRHILYVVA